MEEKAEKVPKVNLIVTGPLFIFLFLYQTSYKVPCTQLPNSRARIPCFRIY